MRKILITLLNLLVGAYFLNSPPHVEANADIRFSVLFSANIGGELEPCG